MWKKKLDHYTAIDKLHFLITQDCSSGLTVKEFDNGQIQKWWFGVILSLPAKREGPQMHIAFRNCVVG